MRVGRSFMTLISYWRGKVLAQMVESTLIVWEDLGLSLVYAIYVLFNYYCF